MTQRNSAKGKKRRKKPEKLEFVQDFIPIKELRHGIIETTDGRYIKILEIEPINFMLRSDDEQFSIISTFASWLKISPMKLQFKSITRRADSDKHVAMVREELEAEPSEECKRLGEDYINLIKDVGSREALTRRFFLIFQYEEIRRNETDDFSQIYSMMQTAEQNARAYFMQCGNNILQPEDPDEATAEILYMFFNRRSCVNEPFSSRVERVVLDTMAAKNKVIGIDEVPHIRFAHFIAPRGIDLKHHNYVVMDGLYYTFLYIKGDGYPSRVRAGWMSVLINAGEGVDIDVHLRRENRSKTIDKVAQRIRLNRTKIKSMQDTSTDYEELANSIQAGYYIKHGIANYNEDLFYMSVFVTVSAKTYEELMWRKQQMIDMLKSMDMYVSDCRFQQETALRSVMPFLKIAPSLEKKAKRNVLTSGAASTYMFTSYELSDDTGVLLGINRHDNNIFDHIVITKIYSNCFFARTVIPMPYEIKLNGTLSDEWCVGDQITATYSNVYYDQENQRVECDFTSVEASDWQPDPNAAYKPVIYLYPEKEMQVSVDLTLDGKLTCTYPAYNNGWNVTATPDGTLTDTNGQTYNYLYWEGETYAQYDMSKGFCVKGEETAVFLEDALAKLGLNRREANEFIVYWLPLMEQNEYNIISFQTDIYTEAAQLKVNPAPDTLIRVFMAWQASETAVDLPEQELTAPERNGFTVVEWGGTELK